MINMVLLHSSLVLIPTPSAGALEEAKVVVSRASRTFLQPLVVHSMAVDGVDQISSRNSSVLLAEVEVVDLRPPGVPIWKQQSTSVSWTLAKAQLEKSTSPP